MTVIWSFDVLSNQILEWNGMSLIDRSFEEVCSIMDRTGDIVELLVEHATDFRMCDLFDENLPPGNAGGQSGPRRSGDGPVGLGLIAGKSLWRHMCPTSCKYYVYPTYILKYLVSKQL